MANILLTYVKKNGRFCLCATVSGTRTRHHKIVEGLRNPNFEKWDSHAQQFASKSKDDKFNNDVLFQMKMKYQALLDTHDFNTGAELFAWQKEKDQGITVNNVAKFEPGISLRQWIETIIEDIKNPKRLKPTSNYQCYKNLLHKLEAEKNLIDLPVAEVNDDTFVQFINWLNSKDNPSGKGKNFVGVMKVFRATINKAKKARLTTYTPDFPYMDYAPVPNMISDKASDLLKNGGTVQSLTEQQLADFRELDVAKVKLYRGPQMEYFKELYRDFALLLYEIKSRPIDVLKLHWDNIALDPTTGRYTLTYIPAKKKNYAANTRLKNNALVVQYLSQEAVRIVFKYRGKSKGGYIFPFKLNQKRWNLDIPEDYHYHYYQANHIFAKINKFLRRAGKQLNVPFDLTLYAFRRSAITHAIVENKIPLLILAKIAGTSVNMIQKHYANYLHTLAAY